MSSRRADPRVGSVLDGRWQLQKKIGQGGVGAVYKATDLLTGETVAVKTMTPEAIEEDFDGLMTKLFDREGPLELIVGGGHGNEGVVKPLSRGIDEDGTHYLVLEYLEGEDLEGMRAKARGRRLSPKIVAPAMANVLATLRRVHREGVVHRDIKPANVFITKRGNVKLLDFGMADIDEEPIVPPGEFLGTAGYAPPEQVYGYETTPKSDVWAVGATAYESLTGHPAAEPDPRVPVACPVPPIRSLAPGVPKHLARIIDASLECDPRDRPTADEMLTELKPHLGTMMAMHTHVPGEASLGGKVLVGASIAAAVAAAVGLAWEAWKERRDS